MTDVYKVLKGGVLIDGTGKIPLENAVVVIKGSKIVNIGEEGDIEIPSDSNIMRVDGCTIIPGLIDAHLHLTGTRSPDMMEWILETDPALRAIRISADAKALLHSGYTAVRCCGSTITIALKRAIDEGTVLGPRIMAARQMITRTGGHERHSVPINWLKEVGLTRLADGIDDCRLAVREQLRGGADFIKICTGVWGESKRFPYASADYSINEIEVMVEEAHRSGVRIASHALGKEGIHNAVVAGVDTIEHGRELDEEVCKIMAKNNVILVPTLAATILKQEDRATETDPKWRVAYEPDNLEQMNNDTYNAVRIAHASGVKIAAGSDITGAPLFGGYPMGKNAVELEYLTRCGLSPMESLMAATKIGAEALGLIDQIGTVESGKLADILVINGNPLEDIRLLQNSDAIRMIIKNGDIVVDRNK
ncbi:amidohydrolase family protein [Candidatus Thorarchaeota archaeon]|nr:MAG: amidohydrolase family protein [Candidatus Thorarchaeota archaeon]